MVTTVYPQDLLDRVKAAHHTPPAEEQGSRFRFIIVDENIPAYYKHEESRDVVGQFDTIEEANQAALDYFSQAYGDYLHQREDMSNFYEAGTSNDDFNTVEWSVDERGALSLNAHEAEGDEAIVSVHDLELRD